MPKVINSNYVCVNAIRLLDSRYDIKKINDNMLQQHEYKHIFINIYHTWVNLCHRFEFMISLNL